MGNKHVIVALVLASLGASCASSQTHKELTDTERARMRTVCLTASGFQAGGFDLTNYFSSWGRRAAG